MPNLTPDQIAKRREGMGATDVVEVAGLSPWEGAGPWRVWSQKLGILASPNVADSVDGRRLTGTLPNPPSTEEQAWGHVQEAVIADWYCNSVGPFVYEPTRRWISAQCDWLWASLDGVDGDVNVEIKNVSGFMARAWDPLDSDGVPYHVIAQVQIGMFCRPAKEARVVACLGGRPPNVWTVKWDHELAYKLVERGAAFWRALQERREPPVDASDACREYMRHKYPRDERKMLTPSVADMVRLDDVGARRAEAAAQMRAAERLVKECDTTLLAAIGDHAGYECEAFKMTWKLGKDGKRRSRFTARGGEGDE